MKNDLCAYINHAQNDWVDSLLMAEFAVSNHVNASIKVTPFFTNHEFHPCIGIESSDIYNDE